MIRYALNKCLIKIDRRFQDANGSIKIDTTWHPEEFATMEGIVYSAPKKVEYDHNRKMVGEVQDGDKVYFSYSVVFGYTLQPENQSPIYKNLVIINGEEYWKVDVGDLFFKVKGEEIEMITDHVLMGFVEHSENSLIYGEMLQVPDKRTGEEQKILQGVSQREYEELEKNTPANRSSESEGQCKELRECLLQKGKDKEGELYKVQQPGVGNASRGLQQTNGSNLVVPELSPRVALFRRSNKIEHLGVVKALPNNKSLSVRVGDTVCFEPRFVQKYNILGQQHLIIQTHRLLAKV